MKTQLRNRLLSELLDILLCIVIAMVLGFSLNHRVKTVVIKTIEDIHRTEWVKAARHADEPSQETPLDDETKL